MKKAKKEERKRKCKTPIFAAFTKLCTVSS